MGVICVDQGLTLQTAASLSFHCRNLTLTNLFDTKFSCFNYPPTRLHSSPFLFLFWRFANADVQRVTLKATHFYLFFLPEIPEFLSNEECDHIISLAIESGLKASTIGRDIFKPEGLDEAMKTAGA